MAKTPNTREAVESIDLALRFKNDGGPVFEFLASLKNSHMRGERVRQLLYLGLLHEGELRRQSVGPTMPVRTLKGQPQEGQITKSEQEPDAKQAQGSGGADELTIHASDLCEIFGAYP